jgi:hypothetical protein
MVSNPTPSYYQWRKDGLNLPGTTDMSYYLSNVQFADAGSYSVFVSNGQGGITSTNAVLNVGILPAITSQPASLIVTQGQSATFSVTSTGTPLNYFWKKNGVFMPGATNSSYSIASVVAGNVGTYSCQVSNFVGSVASANATLTILGMEPPFYMQGLVACLAGNGVHLSFPAPANCAYSVLFATNMTSGPWQKLADVAAQEASATAQVTDSPTSPRRFYRVVTPPSP